MFVNIKKKSMFTKKSSRCLQKKLTFLSSFVDVKKIGRCQILHRNFPKVHRVLSMYITSIYIILPRIAQRVTTFTTMGG